MSTSPAVGSDALALLDLEGGERFDVGVDLLPAAALPYDVVAEALADDRVFARRVAGEAPVSLQQIGRLRSYWCAQQGLVDGDDLQRLLWILRTFAREVEVDLLQHVGVRLGDLWQRRQWRLLLNLIDHLPRTTWTQSRMANHPEFAERAAEAVARARLRSSGDEAPSTPLTEWTPEVSTLAMVVDAVNALRQTLIAVNSEKGKQPPKIPMYPRPRTLVDEMVTKKERSLRWSQHQRLAEQLLPNK